MIYTASAVKAACNALMSSLFPDLPVYGNTVLDGYTRPSWFAELLSNPYTRPGKYTHEYSYTYKVTMLEHTHDEAFCLDAFDTIRSGFGQTVKVGSGHMVVESITMDWIDERNDVLQVTIDFYPVSEISGRTEDEDPMQDLTLSTTLNIIEEE